MSTPKKSKQHIQSDNDSEYNGINSTKKKKLNNQNVVQLSDNNQHLQKSIKKLQQQQLQQQQQIKIKLQQTNQNNDNNRQNHPQIQSFQLIDNNIIMTDKQSIFQQQIKTTLNSLHCQWQLKISNHQLQCSIAKPCKQGQYKDRVIIYQRKNIQKIIPPLTQKVPNQVSNTYSTFIWLIKIITLIKQQHKIVYFKQNGLNKTITVQDLIKKLGYLINHTTNNNKQDILCFETLKCISSIYAIKNQDFSENIERIQNAIALLNKNIDQIKNTFIDKKICQALSKTQINLEISKDHILFRNFLFNEKKITQSQQTLIQNLAIILIYSQKIKNDPEYQFIAQIMVDCFERQQKSEKWTIIKSIAEEIRGSNSFFNKLLSILRRN